MIYFVNITLYYIYALGLMYSIDRTFGNCTIEYLDESSDGMGNIDR